MSDFNPLNPNLDLSCPNLNACLDNAIHVGEDAWAELNMLHAVIKAQREQMERTERAMVEYAARDKAFVDKLCDIRDMLKASMADATDISCWVRRSDAIKGVLKKHFSLDLDK
jgi:septal ring factor EnvC (AmiA/AmiB activator)